MQATATARYAPTLTRSLQDQIRERAYELYLQRGEQHGHDVEDWLQAEAEILQAENARVDEALMESFPASDSLAL